MKWPLALLVDEYLKVSQRVHKFSIGDSNDHDTTISFSHLEKYLEEPKDTERFHLLRSIFAVRKIN